MDEKVFCEDCLNRRTHKTAVGSLPYCAIYDVKELENEFKDKYKYGPSARWYPVGRGSFSGNNSGDCPDYHKNSKSKGILTGRILARRR